MRANLSGVEEKKAHQDGLPAGQGGGVERGVGGQQAGLQRIVLVDGLRRVRPCLPLCLVLHHTSPCTGRQAPESGEGQTAHASKTAHGHTNHPSQQVNHGAQGPEMLILVGRN